MGSCLLNVAFNWRKVEEDEMEENAFKDDIYNGSDFSASKELRGSRRPKSRGRTRVMDEGGRGDGGIKKRGKETHSRVEYEVSRRRRDGMR